MFVNTFWSLVPPIVAIGLALLTKETYSSLFIGIVVGALLATDFSPIGALDTIINDGLTAAIADNAGIFLFLVILGVMVALVNATGGSAAFGRWAASHIHSKAGALLATFALGVLIFIDDYFNCLTVGAVMRPVTESHKISRAKLAYILDSTSSPVCILVPITGWGVYIMGIIATEFENLGIQTSDASAFVQAIPYQFYALLALVLVPLIALSKRDFGPMAKFETYVLENGPTAAELEADKSIVQSENANKATAWEMIIPLLVMFVTIFVMFIGWGFPGQNIPGSKIRIALTSGYMLATIVLAIMVIVKKIMTFTEVVDTWVSGIKKMAGILAIIIAAWGVGSVCTALGTSQFVVDCTIGFLSPALVPALLFIIGAVISFATGTSWGTMAILLPLGINMAYGFGVSEAITIAAVLSGSLFGDHCAPISDTTVMSSMAGGCNHIDHVRTQIPYALLAAVASFIAYLIVGVTQMAAGIALPVALAILVVLFLLATRLFGKKIA